MQRLGLFAVVMLAGLARAQAMPPDDVRVLIVMGGGTWESTVYRFFDALDGVQYTLADSDREAFAEPLQGRYDAILMYNLSGTLPQRERGHLVQFLEGGGGLVVLHHALANYGDWPWWHQEVVGGRYLLAPDGVLPASTYLQDQSIMASVVKEHPVVASLGGHPVHIYDETYRNLWISPRVDVLLRTGASSSDGPLVWIGPYAKARVVVIQPGHRGSAYFNLGFRMIVRDAIRWVASMD